jgi:hypothetical protein
MRTGDHVLHAPSGETWVVAWADHQSGDMSACGWPASRARIADCTVTKVATNDECAKLIGELSKSGRSDARAPLVLAATQSPQVYLTLIHNEVAGRIVKDIVAGTINAGGDNKNVMVLTESVLVGVALATIRLGGDEKVLDVMFEAAKARLAELRLKDLPTEGRG